MNVDDKAVSRLLLAISLCRVSKLTEYGVVRTLSVGRVWVLIEMAVLTFAVERRMVCADINDHVI